MTPDTYHMTNKIIARLKALADPAIVQKKQEKFGVRAEGALGVYIGELNKIAKEIGKNNEVALALFNSSIYEGKILCSKIYKPQSLKPELMEEWVRHFNNWEICDSFSMKFFASSPYALQKIYAWTEREPEFEKRAGFVMIAAYGSTHKKAKNEEMEQFFPLLEREAHDNRTYVKKAVNWALREIGKRNIDLNKKAIEFAQDLLKRPEPAAQWIAKDALKELEKEDLSLRGFPRPPYQRGKKGDQ